MVAIGATDTGLGTAPIGAIDTGPGTVRIGAIDTGPIAPWCGAVGVIAPGLGVGAGVIGAGAVGVIGAGLGAGERLPSWSDAPLCASKLSLGGARGPFHDPVLEQRAKKISQKGLAFTRETNSAVARLDEAACLRSSLQCRTMMLSCPRTETVG
jgi:hypothetical protein